MPSLPMRDTQDQRRARTRARLLKAAGTVFAEQGYHGATLDLVLTKAGLSRGALYHHFRSKHELFLALLNERLTTAVEHAARPTTKPTDGAGASTDIADAFLDRVNRDPRWLPLLLEFLAIGCRDAQVRAGIVDSFLRPARQQTADLISQARAGGAFGTDRLAVDELATGVTALINGLAIERAFDPDAVSADLPSRLLNALAEGASALHSPAPRTNH